MENAEKRRSWGQKDDEDLIRYWDSVGSIVLISLLMGRTPSSIQTQASRKGLPRRAEERARHRRRWSDEEIAQMDRAIEETSTADGRFPIKDVADKVGRSIDAIAAKLTERYEDPAELLQRIVLPNLKPVRGAAQRTKAAQQAKSRTDPNGKVRKCLSCQNSFWSEGAHNRICSKCKRREGDADWDW
jgi:hypothetical protein